ncbi:MAG: hypothetical protein KDJ73_00100 [Notoacmeibacter sp.]|nr:hypothetical protein [Notoacmeibacter sp.]MCC0032778.1 hypothetical protein [Brucellaceae bacterium]
MFIVQLKFGHNKMAASEHMSGHKAWIDKGFADGVFLMTGSIVPAAGGIVLADGCSMDELQARVAADPFVVHDVVIPEIIEVAPSRVDGKIAAHG